MLTENGKSMVVIPWALNERLVKYSISVRDVMSGIKAEHAFVLGSPVSITYKHE